MLKNDILIHNRYRLINRIGSGGFSFVSLAHHKNNAEQKAIVDEVENKYLK